MDELRARWSRGVASLMTWWRGQEVWAQRTIIGVSIGVVLGLVVGAIALAAGGGGDSPEVVVATETPTGTSTGTATRTPTGGPLVTDPCSGLDALPWECADDFDFAALAPTPTPEPVVTSLSELHDEFGDAPDATFGRLRIPVLGVDAPLGSRYVGESGVMTTPSGPGDAVWYDFSQWDDLGGSPGGGNNAVFSGHVDYNAYVAYAGIAYRGGGVFRNINLLSAGDVIEVQVGGQTLTYVVTWKQQVSADTSETNWHEILTASVPVDSITLITCGGDFDTAERAYLSRTVVRAERA